MALTAEQLASEWMSIDERSSGVWYAQLLDTTVSAMREQGAALLAAALQGAGRRGDGAGIGRLLEARPLSPEEGEVPAAFHVLAACKGKNRTNIDQALQRLHMGGELAPSLMGLLCQALHDAGCASEIPRVLGLCDVSRVTARDLMRLRRFWTGGLPESWPAVRVWVTGTVTLDPLVPALELGLIRHGFRPTVKAAQFGLLYQDLRDPDGEAAQFQPDVLVTGYDVANLVPELTQPRRSMDQANEKIEVGIQRLADSLRTWRAHSGASVLLHTVGLSELRGAGFADLWTADGAGPICGEINSGLSRVCGKTDGVYLLDLAALLGDIGSSCHDDRRRLFGRFPYAVDAMSQWGFLASDAIRAIKRGPRKVVVCDLDGTMWGGIVGDVGPMSVEVGPDHPGNAFLEFQRALLDLTSQGILLALCSKNDPETALAVFRDHPRMAVKLEDIAAQRIGWEPKPQLIQEIAQELNLGLDSFVFLDDSPQERAAVRAALPMVRVPELPDDPVDRPRFLRGLRELWPLVLTESDRRRSQMYQAQKRSAELKASAGDNVEGFLQSLGQILTVRPAGEGDWSRVAQMHVRTNQFNVTTRRHDETTLRRMVSEGAGVFVGSLQDCFGDQGIVITAVVVPEGSRGRIDTFLMSCRVVGRQVEAAFMNYLVEWARRRKLDALDGEFIQTERNGPSAHLFESLRFSPSGSKKSGGSGQWWELKVRDAVIAAPMVGVREGVGELASAK